MRERIARPRIRTVLLIVNLAILALPLAGIAALRLYENEIVRGTEAQLLAQAALVREVYLAEYEEAAGIAHAERPAGGPEHDALLPTLDLAREVPLPRPPAAVPPAAPPDPLALRAGARIGEPLRLAVRSTLSGIRIVDAGGTVVASSGSELGLSIAAREEVARALRGETVSLLRERVSDEPVPPLASISRGQRYRVFVALPARIDERVVGAVVLSRTPLDISKALWLSRRPILIGACLVLAVVVLVSVLTSLTISRPLRALVERAGRIARGEPDARVASGRPGTLEVARLSEALESMARILEARAAYIRTFASHVSHEFKTPLTTLRGSLELLRDYDATMRPEERRRFIANAEEAASRLDRLVRRLLELARADVARPGVETADPSAVVRSLGDRFAAAGARVTAVVDPGVRPVAMAAEILDEILSNLVDNALQHGGSEVSVRIDVVPDPGSEDARVAFVVEDDGRGISPANAAKIFTPFFTTARERGGSGLGLSIVRSLLEAHGGAIEHRPRSSGAAFRFTIPAAGRATLTGP